MKENPRHFESHFNLGNVYFDEGNLTLAGLHYQTAGEIEPGFAGMYFNLGLVRALQRDFNESISLLERYQKLVSEEEAKLAEEVLASLRQLAASSKQ